VDAAGAAARGREPLHPEGSRAVALWRPAYVGLGSNLDDPRGQVLNARARLGQLPLTRVVLTSPLYASRPLGPVVQPDYVNAVAGLLTQLEPEALLEELRAIEAALGRPAVRERWGPRVIDLDLLSYAHERRSGADLTLPHPGIPERNFVLYPLADIAPDVDLPALGRVAELRAQVTAEGLTRL
jgi:2-amino-4-hydroxy-6-hydroxymethyldihydropteridine diphosphokinase